VKLLLSIFALAVPLLVHAQQGPTIQGAGATFPAEVYTAWGFGYTKERNVALRYQAVGSGEGLKRIASREVDFGASDTPMTSSELEKNDLVQFPTIIGALVPAYNVPGIATGELRLSGQVLSRIYGGQIRMWNDPEIAALNRAIRLPALSIQRLVREEASGSTATFTRYLAKQDPSWEKRVGQKIEWPAETIAVKGTKGMVDALKGRAGAIGYVSYQEVLRQSLSAPQLLNRHGSYVLPSERTITAAVAVSDVAKGEDTGNLIDLNAPDAWPITETTFVLLARTMRDVQQAKRVLNFFYWAFARGDQMAADTGFVALPPRLQARLLSRFRQVMGPDGQPIEFLGGNQGSVLLALRPSSPRAAIPSRPAGA
jgi:phosphate transport system substrate-binding protein